MKPIKSVILILFVLFLFHPAFGFDDEYTRETLRGLKGVYVSIVLDDASRQIGLLESQVREDVELTIRLKGIKVVSEHESFRLPGAPWLYVIVDSFIDKNKEIVFSVGFQI